MLDNYFTRTRWSLGDTLTEVNCRALLSRDYAGDGERRTAPVIVSALEIDIATSDPNSRLPREEIERWFHELREPLLGYLRMVGCRPSLAEEIAQEVFLRLYTVLEAGSEIADVRAWAFRVARNLWVDSRRLDERHRQIGERQYPAAAPDPEREAIERQQRRLIEAEVSRLPRLQRECVNLKARGLRYREIAAALNISTTAAVDHVRRAVKKLAKVFR